MLLRERQLRPLFNQLCRAVSNTRVQGGGDESDEADPLLVVGSKRGRTSKDNESDGVDDNYASGVVNTAMLIKQARTASLCVMIEGLLDRLMGIFAAMVEGQVLEVLTSQLSVAFRGTEGGVTQDESPAKKSKTKKQRAIEDEQSNDQAVLVGALEWNRQQLVIKSRVLDCVSAFAKHKGTMTRAVFDVVVAPVVDQLDVSHAVPDGKRASEAHLAAYESMAGSGVIPCVVQIAQSCRMCTEGTVLWQTLHHRVLKLMRHPAAQVRLTAVHAVRALFEELGDEYLALLADTLPSLAELLEDSSAQVRRHAQILARLLRDLSGEDIDSFLQ
jgi:hypothetical protein